MPIQQPGTRIRYFPNENPGESGSGDNRSGVDDWEAKALCPNVDEVISDKNFSDYWLDSKTSKNRNVCPNFEIELDEDDDWSFKDIVKIPDKILDRQRRRLLAVQPTPTAK